MVFGWFLGGLGGFGDLFVWFWSFLFGAGGFRASERANLGLPNFVFLNRFKKKEFRFFERFKKRFCSNGFWVVWVVFGGARRRGNQKIITFFLTGSKKTKL